MYRVLPHIESKYIHSLTIYRAITRIKSHLQTNKWAAFAQLIFCCPDSDSDVITGTVTNEQHN